MPYSMGLVAVPNTATKICTPGPQGALLQNLGSVVVTLGGPGVVSGSGVTLPATMTSPIFVPGGNTIVSGTVPAGASVFEDLFGIGASAGPTNVAFLAS